MSNNVEFLKKITVKGVCGAIDTKPEKAAAIMTVYGLANEAKADRSDYGDYVRFGGSFEAVDMNSGKAYRSGRMILPGIAEGLLAGALSQDNTESVQFALEIGIKPSKSPVGYDYTVKPLVEVGENDPLADLRGKLALPSPEPETETEQTADNSKKK